MKPVSDIFSKLGNYKPYDTVEGAQRQIMGLKKPINYKQDMEMLRELEQRTGGKFIDDVDQYANPEKVAARTKAMPEYADNETAARLERALKDPAYKQAVTDSAKNSPEYKRLIAAQDARDKALAAKKELGPITEENVAAKIRRGQAGNSQEILDMFSKFPQLADKGMPELLRLSGVRSKLDAALASSGDHVASSGVLGGLIGRVLGVDVGESGITGMILGKVADKYGPKAIKAVLDKYADWYGPMRKALGAAEPKEGGKDIMRAALARAIDNDAPLTANGNFNPGNEPSADAFKSMHDYGTALDKGQNLIQKSTDNIFKAGPDTAVSGATVKPSDTAKLEKQLKAHWAAVDSGKVPDQANKISGALSGYMPQHANAVNSTVDNVSNYLRSQQPRPTKLGALDEEIPVDNASKAEWQKTLNIAQQPLSILHNVRIGTLTPKDVQDFKSMFPGLYAKVSQELMSSMTSHVADGGIVPYKTRLSLSLFLGQPMDSTMTQQAIASAQPMSMPQPAQPGQQKPTKKGTAKLSSLPDTYKTPSQARQSSKQTNE
jgi:hypothetical protein